MNRWFNNFFQFFFQFLWWWRRLWIKYWYIGITYRWSSYRWYKWVVIVLPRPAAAAAAWPQHWRILKFQEILFDTSTIHNQFNIRSTYYLWIQSKWENLLMIWHKIISSGMNKIKLNMIFRIEAMNWKLKSGYSMYEQVKKCKTREKWLFYYILFDLMSNKIIIQNSGKLYS